MGRDYGRRSEAGMKAQSHYTGTEVKAILSRDQSLPWFSIKVWR
jgi:hypothetical protein